MPAPVGPNAGRRCSRPLALALFALISLGCGSPGVEVETVRAVPTYVLTVGDLVQRVRRAPIELGVRTQGVQVVGVLLKLGRPCDVRLNLAGCSAVDSVSVFADVRDGVVDRRTRMSVMITSPEPLEEGGRYVLDGSVEVATDLPERWVLRAQVLARVE